MSDSLVNTQIDLVLTYQTAVMKSNVYIYKFEYEGTFSSTFLWGTLKHYGE